MRQGLSGSEPQRNCVQQALNNPQPPAWSDRWRSPHFKKPLRLTNRSFTFNSLDMTSPDSFPSFFPLTAPWRCIYSAGRCLGSLRIVNAGLDLLSTTCSGLYKKFSDKLIWQKLVWNKKKPHQTQTHKTPKPQVPYLRNVNKTHPGYSLNFGWCKREFALA